MKKKQNLSLALLALVAGLAGGVISSQFLAGLTVFAEKPPTSEKVVIAQEFRLVDEAGKTRGSLSISKSGESMLTLIDAQSNRRIIIGAGAQDNSAGVSVLQPDQKGGAILLAAEKFSSLAFGSGGKNQIRLGTTVDGSTGLTLFAPKAAKNKAAASLQARPDGGEVLTFYDDQGVGRTSVGISPEGFPFVGISDMTGMVRGALRLRDDTVAMALVDKDGKVAWSAP